MNERRLRQVAIDPQRLLAWLRELGYAGIPDDARGVAITLDGAARLIVASASFAPAPYREPLPELRLVRPEASHAH